MLWTLHPASPRPDAYLVLGDATIVISNPDLVPYLVGKTAQQVRDDAIAQISQR